MPLAFITRDDLRVAIRDHHLAQLADDGLEEILARAEAQAIACVRDHLSGRYNLGLAFAATGPLRSDTLVRWIVLMVVYFVYERADEGQRPDWLSEAYKLAMHHLGLIQEGKRSVELPPLLDADTDAAVTRLRTGSFPRRTHSF